LSCQRRGGHRAIASCARVSCGGGDAVATRKGSDTYGGEQAGDLRNHGRTRRGGWLWWTRSRERRRRRWCASCRAGDLSVAASRLARRPPPREPRADPAPPVARGGIEIPASGGRSMMCRRPLALASPIQLTAAIYRRCASRWCCPHDGGRD
jgi:hypothetical protein